eukprot:GGOE01021489.1.p4 GENE.GGOE01021489.1~~GGOE01021489.1.p4  ORF type:complete len:162 (-),score=2.89 GGOE01021489.1:12-497(-)
MLRTAGNLRVLMETRSQHRWTACCKAGGPQCLLSRRTLVLSVLSPKAAFAALSAPKRLPTIPALLLPAPLYVPHGPMGDPLPPAATGFHSSDHSVCGAAFTHRSNGPSCPSTSTPGQEKTREMGSSVLLATREANSIELVPGPRRRRIPPLSLSLLHWRRK